MSDPSAKRQRLDSTGRFSPASPPFDVAAKASGQPIQKPTHPRTPTSPPYPSMSSQPNGGYAASSSTASSDKPSQSSDTTSRSFSQAAMSVFARHPIATPASTTGVASVANIDSDGDAMMEDGLEDEAVRSSDYRRSNHNRQSESLWTRDGRLKASEGICGDQLFKLSTQTYEPSRPHCSQNLFKLYDLERLAHTVARNDPVTGEKINKLRKSYEGHIKTLQIAGKPKATKMDRVFLNPLSIPEEDWRLMKVQGKEVTKALNPDQMTLDPNMSRLLDSAFAGIAPGPLPPSDTAKYRAYIGTDDTVKPKPQDGPPNRTTPFASSAPTPSNIGQHRGPNRPERAGSKRHYTDAAFQGYGEGYGDEYADSTGGEDNAQGNMAKRRKLQFGGVSHPVEVGGARR